MRGQSIKLHNTPIWYLRNNEKITFRTRYDHVEQLKELTYKPLTIKIKDSPSPQRYLVNQAKYLLFPNSCISYFLRNLNSVLVGGLECINSHDSLHKSLGIPHKT